MRFLRLAVEKTDQRAGLYYYLGFWVRVCKSSGRRVEIPVAAPVWKDPCLQVGLLVICKRPVIRQNTRVWAPPGFRSGPQRCPPPLLID